MAVKKNDASPGAVAGVDVVVGVDPGVEGGLAVLALATGKALATRRMPKTAGKKAATDWKALVALWLEFDAAYDVRLAAVELPSVSMGFGQAIGDIGAQHRCVGGHQALVLGVMGWPYDEPNPQRWQKLLPAAALTEVARLKAAKKEAKDDRKHREAVRKALKAGIIEAAGRRWPEADLVCSQSTSARPASGVADALWIAHYARVQLLGQTAGG